MSVIPYLVSKAVRKLKEFPKALTGYDKSQFYQIHKMVQPIMQMIGDLNTVVDDIIITTKTKVNDATRNKIFDDLAMTAVSMSFSRLEEPSEFFSLMYSFPSRMITMHTRRASK
ncbi:hypothetical protein CHS0354_032458 [Potamilus streckersoni]|uniref:Uncharacterized protein n=1 Tax=Potamilus streckersoni TaxID=2493646 RepID=A0AAE0SQ25_9BIVA|nr:hypothetical protein CHS0354_032458 [Potamilus streckersoni]